MRILSAIGLALLLVGCAAQEDRPATPPGAADRVAQAPGLAAKAQAANEACVDEGRVPGTEAHAACVRMLLRAEGQRVLSLTDVLTKRAAKSRNVCIDRVRLRLVRCYDI